MKEIHLKKGPFIQTGNRSKNILNSIFLSLIPLIIFYLYKNGVVLYEKSNDILTLLLPLFILIASGFSSFITDVIISNLKKENKKFSFFLKNKHSFLPGIILALILPVDTPIYLFVFGGIVVSLISRITISGISIFNSVSLGVLIINLIYSFIVGSNLFKPIVIEDFSLWTMFFGNINGYLIITNTFLSLLAFLFLIYKKAIKWKIPIAYILTIFIMTYIIGILNNQTLFYPLYHILSGGLLFLSVFVASDSLNSPTTNYGQIMYAVFLGILTVIFRYYISDSLAIIFSILIMNLFNLIIDEIGALTRFGLKKGSILILVGIILVLGISLYIALTNSIVINLKV